LNYKIAYDLAHIHTKSLVLNGTILTFLCLFKSKQFYLIMNFVTFLRTLRPRINEKGDKVRWGRQKHL